MSLHLNWINPEDYSFNSFLLMEHFQLRILLNGSRGFPALAENLAAALANHPAVKWYFMHKCPECADYTEALAAKGSVTQDAELLRKAEVFVLSCAEDFVAYTTPEVMDTHCDFIYGWNKERLFEMADFEGKTVIDVGSGNGRLAFAAAEKAHFVVASEPVDTLREYMRGKIRREGIRNVVVSDGMADSLPYPDDTFDIVMSGHVVGDDYDAELAGLTRIVKSGGWILDCPGDQRHKCPPSQELVKRGFEEMRYVGSFGFDVYRYRKQVIK